MDRFVRFCCAAALCSVMSLPVATGARAYSPEQEQMCTGDAMRLCSSEIPDVDRITACMIQRQAELSPGCKVFFRAPPPPPEATPAPRAVEPPPPAGSNQEPAESQAPVDPAAAPH